MGFGNKVCGAVRGAGRWVREKASGAVEIVREKAGTLALTVCVGAGAVLGGGSAFAEETGTAITLPASPINWKSSVDALVTYLGANLATILGLTLGIVAIIVVFRWMVKGASGKA